MNERRNLKFLYGGATAILVGLITLPVSGERILYLDASAPGEMSDTEGTFWLDHTANEYDLIATGDPIPVHVDNPGEAGDYWDFEQNSGFKGIGDDNLLDFETDAGAGPGLGDPFSVNVYLNWGGPHQGDTPYIILTKADKKSGSSHFSGYSLHLSWDQPNSASLNLQGGNNQLRHYLRDNDPAGSLENRDAMITMTHDGSGSTDGTDIFVNGVSIVAPPYSFNESDLAGSTLNDDQLELGINDDHGNGTNNGMNADVYFVEIYDHALTVEEVVSRWNNGEPQRATVNPIRTSDSGFLVSSLTPVNDIGIEFLSELGKTYELQAKLGESETNTNAPPSWAKVEGAGTSIAGTGGTLILSDPGGYDSNKTYRVFTSF